jgi:hypothetical protein
MSALPFRRDVTSGDELDVHFVRLGYYLKTPILHRRFVDGKVGGQMIDFSNVVIRGSIEMSVKAATICELVIDLLLEQ